MPLEHGQLGDILCFTLKLFKTIQEIRKDGRKILSTRELMVA